MGIAQAVPFDLRFAGSQPNEDEMSNSHNYGGTFKKGDIVWIHPACDAFMQGDLCGVVAIVGRKWITVRMTRSNRKLKFSPDLLAIDSIY